jgi:siderophore synthetase component
MERNQVMEQVNSFGGDGWSRVLQSPFYPKVEQRIIRQLIESLIFEDIVTYERTLPLHNDGEEQFVIQGTAEDGQSVHYLSIGSRKKSFDRIRLSKQPIQRMGPEGESEEAQLIGFITEVLNQAGQNERLVMFTDEIVQTLLKDTQAQYENPRVQLSGMERNYDELEGNIMDGHPYHPCYKSRIGFNLQDNEAYGPEFKPEIKPVWLAVSKAELKLTHSVSLNFPEYIKGELGDAVYADFVSVLQANNKKPKDYWFVAVHPWQWREVISTQFYHHLVEGRMILLGEGKDIYRPQQSIRTMANFSSPEKAYLKLPLSITNTSTGRILAQHTILNAPLISDWLQQLQAQDAYAKRLDFVLLLEVAGISYDHDFIPELLKTKTYGVLGVIWRESLHRHLRQGEEAVPFNALCHVEGSALPFIAPWIQEYGVHAWTQAMVRVSVLPVIHMLFAHGVAMESHAQNMILIHTNGWPTRLALKDFHDGIRFSRRHLNAPALCPELHPAPLQHLKINRNSFIETDDPSDVRDFVHDAFFFINLAEIAMFLEQHYGLTETEFWSFTTQVIHDYMNEHPQYKEKYELFDLFSESIQVEQLTKRRLFGDNELRVQSVPNPLHAFRWA